MTGPIPKGTTLSLNRGTPVTLVRWYPARDGWAYDLREGIFESRDRDSITVLVGDEIVVYARSAWDVCVA